LPLDFAASVVFRAERRAAAFKVHNLLIDLINLFDLIVMLLV
jgi:hypothetical protein